MTTQSEPITGATLRTRAAVSALIAASGFVLAYFATELVVSRAAASALPLPNSSSGTARDWYAGNQLAAVLMGVCQAVSVLFLAWFVRVVGAQRSRPWGLVAVVLMLLASACAWTLAAVAPTASLGVVETLRDASFIAGGTAHVVALGTFAFLTSREGGFGRPVRVLSTVALGACVLSLSSLFVFEGAAFILLGRLLSMAWATSAAVSLGRRMRRVSR